MDLRALAIRGVKWTSIGTIVTSVFQFTQNVILARLLTPEDFGLMAIIVLVTGVGRPISDFGLNAAIIQKQSLSSIQYSTLYWFSLLIGIILFLLFYFSTTLFSTFFQYQGDLDIYLKVSFVSFLVIPIGAPYTALLTKMMKFDYLNQINIWNAVGTFLFSVLLAYYGLGLWALVGGFLFNLSFQSLFSIIGGWKYAKVKPQFNLPEAKGLIQFGFFDMASNFVNFMSSNIDKLLIGKFLDAHALGLYTLAWNLVLYPVKKINPILTKVAFPVFANIQLETERLNKYYFKLVYILMAINIPILLGLAIVTEEFLFFIYGPQWTDGAMTLSVLCFVGLYRCFSNPGGNIILAKGRSDVGFYWNVLWSLVLAGFMAFFLYLNQSIVAIAWGQVVAICLMGWYWHYLVIKIGRISYKGLLRKIGGLLLYAILLLGIDLLFNYWLKEINLVGFIFEVLISALVYFVFIFIFFSDLLVLVKGFLGVNKSVK